MAVGVEKAGALYAKLLQLQFEGDVFALLLFDARPSHAAVELFADTNFDWIDQLATNTRTYFFVWRRTTDGKATDNPSPEVAALFGIRPNQLPGIIFFAVEPQWELRPPGAFLPLDSTLFEEEAKQVEDLFASLFSLIHECRDEGATGGELIECLRSKLVALRTMETGRPILKYLKDIAHGLADIPQQFAKSFTEAMAKGITKGFIE